MLDQLNSQSQTIQEKKITFKLKCRSILHVDDYMTIQINRSIRKMDTKIKQKTTCFLKRPKLRTRVTLFGEGHGLYTPGTPQLNPAITINNML